jgi:glycosyltransferase involved in cell wall biosynthesis
VSRFIINGKFLSQRMTGVQRFAYELVSALDGQLTTNDGVSLAVPSSVSETQIPNLHAIAVARVGSHHGVRWEQCDFPSYCHAQHAIPVNLCNAAPLRNPGIVCIHDVKVKRFPEYFTWKFRLWYDLLFSRIARKAVLVLTVSEFSKKEIEATLHIPERKIVVVPNAWQHLEHIVPSDDVLSRYHVLDKGFFFMLGSLDPNKNLAWLVKEAQRNPQETFLVSGSIDRKVFAKSAAMASLPSNVTFLGYASDEDVKGLMTHCKALVFPSFYEGFGVPPLEALRVGSPIIVSDIPVLREIYHEAAIYIDPHRTDYVLEELLATNTTGADKVLASYDWKISAGLLKDVLEREGKP